MAKVTPRGVPAPLVRLRSIEPRATSLKTKEAASPFVLGTVVPRRPSALLTATEVSAVAITPPPAAAAVARPPEVAPMEVGAVRDAVDEVVGPPPPSTPLAALLAAAVGAPVFRLTAKGGWRPARIAIAVDPVGATRLLNAALPTLAVRANVTAAPKEARGPSTETFSPLPGPS